MISNAPAAVPTPGKASEEELKLLTPMDLLAPQTQAPFINGHKMRVGQQPGEDEDREATAKVTPLTKAQMQQVRLI